MCVRIMYLRVYVCMYVCMYVPVRIRVPNRLIITHMNTCRLYICVRLYGLVRIHTCPGDTHMNTCRLCVHVPVTHYCSRKLNLGTNAQPILEYYTRLYTFHYKLVCGALYSEIRRFACIFVRILYLDACTSILIIIEGQFEAFQLFSSGKLVSKTVESCFDTLNWYMRMTMTSGRFHVFNNSLPVYVCTYVCMYVCMYTYGVSTPRPRLFRDILLCVQL